ncbi:MAG: hypothetical protein NC225_03845 [Clostridium sp.]|nr:hypothetical protein [Clostridium sp.]MCM1398599.1 hypothetical protein [Clostridium sp.]MCM1459887.1 hypothetical protein [Bacteroides sp.]
MKKRIIISILVLLVIAVGVIVIRHYNDKSNQEDESGGYYEWFSEVRYYPESGLNFDAISGEVQIEAPCKHTFTMDTEVTDGGVTFNVYYYDHNTDKPDEGVGDLIRSEHITETGVYTYNLDDLSDGWYWLEIKRDNKDVRVNVKYKFIQDGKYLQDGTD